MKRIKQAFLKNSQALQIVFASILCIAQGNLLLQFFLRFLLTDWIRILWISSLIYLAIFPISLWLVRQIKANLPLKQYERYTLIGLSAIVSVFVYLIFPIKITGNLTILETAPLWLYRASRLANILSFFLSTGFAFFLVLVSLDQKTTKRPLWRLATIAFFTLLLLVGLLVYQDYGISSDEPNERTSGLVSAHYLASYIEEELLEPNPYIPKLSNYRYRYYGVAHQLPLALMENNTLTRGQDVWRMRHLANFILFYVGVVAFFHLTAEFFGDSRYGLLSALFLTLSPRLFAHAFFNPKDTVFMAAFTIALYFCARFWQRKTYWGALLAGIACAYAANIRVVALALPLITLGILLLDWVSKGNKPGWKQTLVYILGFSLFVILLSPAAWESPLAHFGRTISLFSDYAYWNFRVMYLGEFIRGSEAPWHYLPVWIGITIPLPHILFFLTGIAVQGIYFIRKGGNILKDNKARLHLIFLGIVLSPPLLAILLNSTLYNGWRHFQFIYPSFLIIAMLGLQWVFSKINLAALKSPKAIILFLWVGLSGCYLLLTGFWMVSNHPHQAVYFNPIGYLIGRENFERDYWRISVKSGLETLLRRDPAESLTLCMESQFEDPEFLMILTEEERSRINIITDPITFGLCDYALNTYRSPNPMTCKDEFYEINVDGLPILTITACKQN